MTPIVRHLRTSIPYEFLGGVTFRNMITGAEGTVGEELASKVFKINLEMSVLCRDYPLIKDLVRNLKLKIEKDEK